MRNSKYCSRPSIVVQASRDTICEGENIYLSSNVTGGQFVSSAVLGNVFSTSVSGAGSHRVYYSKSYQSNCIDSAFVDIFVKPNPAVNFTIPSVCEKDDSLILVGSPAGGSFIGIGVSNIYFIQEVPHRTPIKSPIPIPIRMDAPTPFLSFTPYWTSLLRH